MENFYKNYIVLLLSLLAFSCTARSIEQDSGECPEWAKPLCESNMAKTFTETAADADFSTGQVYPVTGDIGPGWWDVLEASIQQGADRSQAIRKLVGITNTNYRDIVVPIGNALQNTSARFTQSFAGTPYWEQTSVASAGFLQFEVPPLPVGTVISQVTARWGNEFAVAAASSIGTPPRVRLVKLNIAVSQSANLAIASPTTVGTQADTTSVLATYQALHNITLTIAETVSIDSRYTVDFAGEDGANEGTGGVLAAIQLKIILP